MNAPSRLSSAALYTAVVVIVGALLLPFVWVVFGSFKTQGEFLSDPGAWFPQSFQVQNYVDLFVEEGFGLYFVNSAIVSVVAVSANVLFSSMAGYALAKLEFRGKNLVFSLVIFAWIVPYVAIFVPQFLVIVQLGLVNTLSGIIAPLLVTPLSVFIMRQFAYSLPTELLEAGRVDGASEARLFFGIFLPLSGPPVATIAILSFLGSWNSFLWPLIVAQSEGTFTLPVALAVASQASNTTEFGILLAGAVVVLLPVLILFLFLQKYFIQGVATAGIK
ncbi:carbohydrate ABC transporter permease [Microbacterium sp. zg.Y1090]|uniref:carbohydrate ABC transporter permease n=1 Tax=Microbacterium TaxID=33882 RepID=UPI00214AF7FE|nr:MULTISPECIES: carbohydrate ABC transporter permease [unclassified Microbacterium]MCR2812593.1 carbohydrate ABC transporter permease [Microbacterium sp. zg.Y1084]MCR2817611.1 carbohydrate ABC transporter permease [Microbacterium sp. zg.Y1090]MDL5485746.1 carbohydrate ABC transporter permease [Microbacterium sp. zg-Y1211]WIM28913.1 carbohydrate ABC transporter permease [Microbacterium sp. zg-Y1090]